MRDIIFDVDVFLVFAGVYSSRSDWIEFEIATAFAQYKPIIAVAPQSQKNYSSVVMKYKPPLVMWNSKSVTSKILESLLPTRRAELERQLQLSEAAKTWAAKSLAPSMNTTGSSGMANAFAGLSLPPNDLPKRSAFDASFVGLPPPKFPTYTPPTRVKSLSELLAQSQPPLRRR